MSDVNHDRVNLLIHRLSLKHNIPTNVLKRIINSPYKFTKEKITELDIKEDITEEEFNKLKTNFNYLHLGKLYTSFEIFKYFKLFKENRWKK